MDKKLKAKQKYYYRQTIYECPVCGSGETIKERVYGEKPKDQIKIYCYEQIYCGCMER